jgi:hypothetical protein
MFFGLFDFGKHKKSKHTPDYDPHLIDKFIKEHKELVSYIGSIQEAMDQGASATGIVKNYLKHLRMQLLGHFMEEDIKLYWYMKEYYKEDPTAYDIVITYEESIKAIQKDILKFFEHYSRDDVKLDAEYRRKFRQIVSELSDRVKSEEEHLYTLYRP